MTSLLPVDPFYGVDIPQKKPISLTDHASAPVSEFEAREIKEILSHVPADITYPEWYKVLAGLHQRFEGSEQGLAIADDWSRQGEKYKGCEDVENKWKSFRSDGGITIRTVYATAKDNGAPVDDIEIRYEIEELESEVGDLSFHGEFKKTYTTYTKTAKGREIQGLEGGIGGNKTYASPIPTATTLISDWKLKNPEEDLQRLQSLNQTYSHVVIGGKHLVASVKPCPVNGQDHTFESLGEFKNYYLHELSVWVEIGKGKDEKNKSFLLGDAWLRWPGKAFYPNGVGFYPAPKKCPEQVYNLYTGSKLEPKEGDFTPWLTHVRDVICAGDTELSTYLLQWFAHLIQKPDEKPSVAVVLKSAEGAGKGTLVAPLLRILGPHGIQINGGGQITGRFNSTIANKLLVFADEVDLIDKSVADRLKGIVSEPTLNLERKGIDPEPIPNYARLIFASNHDRVIRAGLRERRYLVLEPCERIIQDRSYFDPLWTWIKGDGPACLLHYLMNLSLEGFDPRRCPVTASLIREKLSSLHPVDQYLLERLEDDDRFGAKGSYPVSLLIDEYRDWCEQHSIKAATPQSAGSIIGKRMTRMGIEVQGRSGRGQGKAYQLPDPEEMRSAFAEMLGSTVDEVF